MDNLARTVLFLRALVPGGSQLLECWKQWTPKDKQITASERFIAARILNGLYQDLLLPIFFDSLGFKIPAIFSQDAWVFILIRVKSQQIGESALCWLFIYKKMCIIPAPSTNCRLKSSHFTITGSDKERGAIERSLILTSTKNKGLGFA
jgi:hypothetical protein